MLCIDPGEANPVEKFLETNSFQLIAVLLTHHHSDHVGGVKEIKSKYSPKIYGPNETNSLVTQIGSDGDILQIGPFSLGVIETPGHTKGHIVYYLEKEKILFSGDTLFCGGCGRLFEGSYLDMFMSLQKLRKLPLDTLVYPGHEYTEKNLEFALSVDSENPLLISRYEKVKALRAKGKMSVPSTIFEEINTNPFLRTKVFLEDSKLMIRLNTSLNKLSINESDLLKGLNLSKLDDDMKKEVLVFAKLRYLKDNY